MPISPIIPTPSSMPISPIIPTPPIMPTPPTITGQTQLATSSLTPTA
jgi:hypothetical protein